MDVLWSFPGGRFDRRSLELEVGGRRRRLEPRHGDTLALLLARAGEVVTKEELLQQVWHGRHVTDDALVVAIYKLRRALGDRARSPRYIETIAKRGYRWVAEPVAPAADCGEAMAAGGDPAKRAVGPLPRVPAARWAATSLLPVLLLGAFWLLRPAPPEATGTVVLAGVHPLLAERDPAGLGRALEILDWRLAEDPDDAEALALRGRAMVFAAEGNPTSRPALVAKARQSIDRALELAPGSRQGLLADGLLALLHERDGARAERSLGRALRLAPQDPQGLAATAWLHSVAGRHRAALESARRSLALDPASVTGWTDLAFLAAMAGEPEQALRAAEIARATDASSGAAAWERLRAQRLLGRAGEGIGDYLAFLRRHGVPAAVLEELDEAAAAGGWPAFHARLVSFDRAGVQLVPRAIVALEAGDREGAMSLLTAAAARGDWETLWLQSLPELRPLHGDPAFAALLRAHRPTTEAERPWQRWLRLASAPVVGLAIQVDQPG